MTPKLTFTLDGTIYPNPFGWEDMSLIREFDGRVLRTRVEGELTYFHDAYEYINAKRTISPCESVTIVCTAECDGTTYNIFTQEIRIQDCRFNCSECRVTFQIETGSGWTEIEKNESEEVCMPADTTLSLFQTQSGGTLGTGKFKRVFSVLEEIAQKHGGSSTSVNSNLFNSDDYQPHILSVTLPSVSDGDTLQIILFSALGSKITATATMPTGVTQLQATEIMRNALLYLEVPGQSIAVGPLELTHRLSKAVAGSGVLTITSDWEIDAFQLFHNSVLQSSAATTTQAYQYSLKDLYISSKGLEEDNICMSFGNLTEALNRIHPIVIEDEETSVRIDGYQKIIPNSGGTNTISNRKIERDFYEDWLKENLFVGFDFQAKGWIESFNAWEWVATPEAIADPFTTYFPTNTGPASLSGIAYVINNSATTSQAAAIELLVNGSVVASAGVPSLSPGQSQGFDLAGIFITSADNSFCLSPTDTVLVQIASSGADIAAHTGHTTAIQFGTPCYDSPFIVDFQQYLGTIYNTLEDFSGCGGVIDRGIDQGFEGGMGLAISQQLQGDQDYADTHFLVVGNAGGTEALKFERQFFFSDQSTICDCDQDRIVSWYWYNLLLQRPHLLNNLKGVVPSDISLTTYDIQTTVSSSLVYSQTVTQQNTLVQSKEHSRVNQISFEKAMDLQEWIQRTGENIVPVEDCGESSSGVIRLLELDLQTMNAKFELEA